MLYNYGNVTAQVMSNNRKRQFNTDYRVSQITCDLFSQCSSFTFIPLMIIHYGNVEIILDALGLQEFEGIRGLKRPFLSAQGIC
jgi:hypothetical protein